MGTRKIIIMLMIVFFFFCGCGYRIHLVRVEPEKKSTTTTKNELKPQYYAASSSVNPVTLTYADIETKKVYIQKASETLKHFFRVARDLKKRKDISNRKELGFEASSYIKHYVEPILNDAGAIDNLGIKAEVAKLYLECAYLFYELAGYYQARYYLRQLAYDFESNFVLGITTDQIYTGFNTVAEGIAYLNEMVSLKLAAKTATT